ncbi:MAG: hypothetical protein JST00_46760 [Deltaproteobacteria bacterium]|nr:hypothetical protein [Deltaproteobacteria bacterium]
MRITLALGALLFVLAPNDARADAPPIDAPAPAPAVSTPPQVESSPAPPAPAAPPARTERNSVAMMITGISLGAIGLVAVGVGTGLMIQGHQNCDRDAAAKTAGLNVADASALYPVAEDLCVGESAMINGGLASLIGGSVFAAAGVAFTIGGAWKVTVPERAATTPSLRIGLGSLSIGGAF